MEVWQTLPSLVYQPDRAWWKCRANRYGFLVCVGEFLMLDAQNFSKNL